MIELLGAVTQVVVALAALGAFILSWHNSRRIQQVHLLMNSRLTELLDVTRKSSRAEGLKEGRAENK